MKYALSAAAMAAALIIAMPPAMAETKAPTEHGGMHAGSGAMPAEHGATTTLGDLTISAAWMRQPPPGGKVGGGYLAITNTGAADDRLVSADVDFAKRTEIHEMKMEGGTMMMAPLDEGLVIPAGETVTLAPGGFHVMFMGLQAAPQEGEAVPVTLHFEKAGTVTVDFAVAGMGASAAPHSNHDGAAHGMKHGTH